jgi:diguanylate cyclase (GGDEF)-like protein
MAVRDSKQRKIPGKVARERRGRRARSRNGRTVSVTISIGAAQPNNNRQSVEKVLKAADTALYRAKKNGRNCLCMA